MKKIVFSSFTLLFLIVFIGCMATQFSAKIRVIQSVEVALEYKGKAKYCVNNYNCFFDSVNKYQLGDTVKLK